MAKNINTAVILRIDYLKGSLGALEAIYTWLMEACAKGKKY
ncbi:MAG: hypothetical protein AAGA77_23055 [Bacteroidota bacterium]